MDDDRDGRLTRRGLLATGAVAAASMTLVDTTAYARPWRAGAKTATRLPRYARKGYRRARFSPHVGTSVKLRPRGAAAVRGTLVGIEDVPYVKSLVGNQDAYTLRLRVPGRFPMPEGIAGIRHKHFGVVELYIAPTPSNGLWTDYAAVVNRHIPGRTRRRLLGR